MSTTKINLFSKTPSGFLLPRAQQSTNYLSADEKLAGQRFEMIKVANNATCSHRCQDTNNQEGITTMNSESLSRTKRPAFAAALRSTVANLGIMLMTLFVALVAPAALVALPVVAFSGALIGWALAATIAAVGFLLLEARLETKARLAGERRTSPGSMGLVIADPEFWLLTSTIAAVALWVATIVQAFLV